MVVITELIIFFILAGPVLTLVALFDLLRRPDTDWEGAGQDRMVWALVVVFVGFVGPALYLTSGRAKLNAAANADHQPATVS